MKSSIKSVFTALLAAIAFTLAVHGVRADESDDLKSKLASFHARVERFHCTYVRTLVKSPEPEPRGERIKQTEGECYFERELRRSRIDEKATTDSGRVFRSVKIDNGDEFISESYSDGAKLSLVIRMPVAQSQSNGFPIPPNLLGLGFAKGNLGAIIKDHQFSALGADSAYGSTLFKVRFFKPGDESAQTRDYWLDATHGYLPAAGEFGATKRSPPRSKFRVLSWGTAKDATTSESSPFPKSISRSLRRLNGEYEVTETRITLAEFNGRYSDALFTVDLKSLPPEVEVQDRIKKRANSSKPK